MHATIAKVRRDDCDDDDDDDALYSMTTTHSRDAPERRGRTDARERCVVCGGVYLFCGYG